MWMVCDGRAVRRRAVDSPAFSITPMSSLSGAAACPCVHAPPLHMHKLVHDYAHRYNPQHYEDNLAWWAYDLELMLPILETFAKRAGKVAILREPPAQHFAGGQ